MRIFLIKNATILKGKSWRTYIKMAKVSAHPVGMCKSHYIITFLFCMMLFLPPLSSKGRAWLTAFELEEAGDRKIQVLFRFLLLTINFWKTLITQSSWKNAKNQSSQERGDMKGNKEKIHCSIHIFSFLHLWQRV